jgi:hypothetical protein
MTAKRHHYVPQAYLRGFADQDERLRTVPLDGAAPFLQAVDTAAAENYYNAVVDEQGERSDQLEVALSSLEGDGIEAIRTLLYGPFPPDGGTRHRLAAYLGLQMARTPRVRAHLDQLTDRMAKTMVAFSGPSGLRRALEESGGEVSDEDAKSLGSYLSEFDQYQVRPDQNTQVRHMLEAAEVLAEPFALLPWALIAFQRKALLTSDNPIGLWLPPSERRPFEGIGLLTADEVWFPINRRTALLVSPHADDGTVLVPTAKWARRINQLVALWAHRWLYHHPHDNPVDGLRLPAPRSMVTIGGPSPQQIAATNVEPSQADTS